MRTPEERRRNVKSRLVITLAMTAVVLAAAASLSVRGYGVSNAYACAWNIYCGNLQPGQEVTAQQAGPWYNREAIQATEAPYAHIIAIVEDQFGGWRSQFNIDYNATALLATEKTSDRVGCYNHHGVTEWVNCRHWDAPPPY
jgi:hypothetical protein